MTKKEYIKIRNKLKNTRAKQELALLDYLWANPFITRAGGFTELGIANLPQVVSKLRHKHEVPVETAMVSAKNRYGDMAEHAKYFITRRR